MEQITEGNSSSSKNIYLGLSAKNSLCKICNSFSDDILNEITLDLVLQRQTYNAIMEKYSKLLPENVKPLNAVNLSNHKRHCNPKLLAEQMMARQGRATTPQDAALAAFSSIFKESLDKADVMEDLYKHRLGNLELMYVELAGKLEELRNYGPVSSLSPTEIFAYNKLQNHIRSLIKQKDEIENSIQQVLLKDSQIEKGLSESTVNVTYNYVVVIQQNIQNFLQEVVPYILEEVFPDDIEQGKKVVNDIAEKLDAHLGKFLNVSEDTSMREIKTLISENGNVTYVTPANK